MKITFLGTGTSQGVPVIACDCEVCTSADRHDKRLRVSVLIEEAGKSLVVDAGPDFRYQMLRANLKHLDAILFTHEHKDHVAGLDDVRAFNFKQQAEIDVYADMRVQNALRQEFHYIFSEAKYPGIPRLELHEIKANQPFNVAGIDVIPISVMHYKLPVFGYRVGNFTYITDAKTIDKENIEKIRGSKIVVINALQKESHISHLTYDEALSMAKEIGAEQTYLTHISHRLGTHSKVSQELPEGIFLAYDGLELDVF
ncbi:MBL fold metallo-hydrolase [Daejeonella lutea]|uniref:Phosphoribosyl 1,2-cyclic phosphate phosphodiesterase n=1 Tax=Daejeonella lutea TaxID=572036 RepID=A0A1T5AU30_9SPHI|nr:MBL fold metallo-hydrolase [Daejeonella lutea]SKB38541.1 phosphoribosyl 1,2-cyclic phosphate phosphodiesterase [Daejeonella lutea]